MGLRRMSDGGVMRAVMASQTTGRGIASIRHLPKEVYARVSTSTHLASSCLDLDAGVVGNHVEACQRALANLQHCLSEWSSSHAGENREAFVVLGGDVVVLRALFYPFCSREDGVEKPSSSRVLAVRRDCLSLLRELCASVAFFAEGLAAKCDFIVRFFSFMGNNITFDQAVSLAEDVLAAREETLRVQDIPDFSLLVRNFSSRQLASFCRVLAMVAFEPEAGNPWVGPHHEQDQRTTEPLPPPPKEADQWTVADRNHDAILLIPDILARLMKLLTFDKVPVTRERLQGFSSSEVLVVPPSSTAHDVESRINPRSHGLHTHRSAGMVALVDEDLLEWNIFLDHTSSTTALVLSHHVEVLFVLCALCGGKRREQVQNQLAELGLVGVLNDMFHKLDWTVAQPGANSRGIHGHGCACNPKSALKIQYLRLIHNFCDRDSCNRANKQLLLQPSISKEGGFSWNKSNYEWKDSEGLMVKILKVLINEPVESLYRFWLASCVEAFLRGVDSKDQEFVASTGLMEHLVNEILKGGFPCATSLQINFDLLGELIKFNKTLFGELNRLLAGDRFDQFVEVLVTNLVDSNVFVRSVVVSMDSFKRSKQQRHDKLMMIIPASSSTIISSDSYKVQGNTPWCTRKSKDLNLDDDMCMITAFVTHNTLRLLKDLMCAVRLSDINQDNICVLNTALIFFIFADKANELPSYLHLLCSADPCTPHKFRALLEFWRSYYILRKVRGRECVSLAYSTRLPFSDWLHVVECLCAPPDSPCSLLHNHYLHSSCLALTAANEPPSRRR